MFNGIEFMLGAASSLMGIGFGYLLLISVFSGINFLSKNRLMKEETEKSLDT